jgi:hypothetical protein
MIDETTLMQRYIKLLDTGTTEREAIEAKCIREQLNALWQSAWNAFPMYVVCLEKLHDEVEAQHG